VFFSNFQKQSVEQLFWWFGIINWPNQRNQSSNRVPVINGKTYNGLDSSGSVKKLTKRVSLERKFGETKTTLSVQQIIPPYYDYIQEFFFFLNTPSLEYPTACYILDSCWSRDKWFFSVIKCHLNNVIIKQNSCL